ncbi:M23 family metallopeptidase [Streptomyces iconiensis]|uniref:M23 family metallopeptidase n=1 Tax=Streptomyces iconiensis TaxID=1384038 RepID=A0ABT6ZW90_9ACTN|nr:M23 family metallopeptidase [Streptomyces iconiensis]MDJ1133319.1 M23 family metallopeptidase [Streptomyces iconiensis]
MARGVLAAALLAGGFAGTGAQALAAPAPGHATVPVSAPEAAPAPRTASATGAYEGTSADRAHPGAAHVTAPWTRPVMLRGVRVSQRYGIKGNWAAGHHTGIDLAVPTGTPVRSVGPGTVVFAGWSGDYGKAVTIRMADGKYTLFAHMSTIAVKRGQRVNAGTWLGRSGNTGRSTGPHLHFEVRAKRGYGTDIDPVRYLSRHGVRLL